MVQTLRGVQYDRGFEAQVRILVGDQVLEVGVGGLVGPDVFRRIDGVETYAQLAVRGGDAAAVDVGKDYELLVLLEDAQLIGGKGNAGQCGKEAPNAASSSSSVFRPNLSATRA